MYRFRYTMLLLLAVVVCACSEKQQSCPMPVMRVDKALAAYAHDSDKQRLDIMDSMGTEIRAMMSVIGVSDINDSVLIAWSESKVVEMFQPPVDSVFKSLHPLEISIGDIIGNARCERLELPPLTFASVVWGSQRPIVRMDSIVLIALNHYLGADFAGYSGWPEYRRNMKSADMIAYNLAGVLAATQYPMTQYSANDNSRENVRPALLNWMLYEGALVEARMRLVPNASLDKALGYTPHQLDFAETNLHEIWEEMRLKRLVYDTNPLTIDKYIAAAPSTPLLEGAAPGRIGAYVGYRIIQAYLSNRPETTLTQMLSPDFYMSASTLIHSRFSP